MTGKYAELAVQTGDLDAFDVGLENLALRSHNLEMNSVCQMRRLSFAQTTAKELSKPGKYADLHSLRTFDRFFYAAYHIESLFR